MADGFSFDAAEMRQLTADLGKVGASAVKAIDPIVELGALNIKRGMAADAASSDHFKGMAGSLSYDRVNRLGSLGAEIGPDKDRGGGALGNIAYFGGANGGGATLDIDGPIRTEEPGFLKALGKALEDLL